MDPSSSSAASSTPRVLAHRIGGVDVRGQGATLDVTNPATGAVLARVPLGTAADVAAAARAAREALPAWRATSPIVRARHLFALRDLMDRHAGDLARCVTAEMGKTLPDARAEVARAIEMVEAATAVPQTMQGRVLEGVATNVDCEMIRQPVGVCAAITPFNFPAMVPMWFLPFAIGCGNTFVLKPSEQDPLTAVMMVDLAEQAGVPPGVINVVHGAADVVNAILDEPEIDAVSFVGSAAVARHVYTRGSAAGKRVQALGGAKNAMVVMPDAVMDKTAENVIASAFGAAGQRCMAGSLLVAVGDAWAALKPVLIEKTQALTVGNGAQDSTDVGPVISSAAADRIVSAIEEAVSAGARLVLDGRDQVRAGGGYVGPTILEGVDPDGDAAREEIFGPVLSVVEVPTLGDAIALVNASRYGNGTSIFTESGAAARRYRVDVQVGMVGINVGVAAPVAFFPFSGWKDSFLGDLHAHGGDAIEFFTRKKTVTSRWFGEADVGRYFVE